MATAEASNLPQAIPAASAEETQNKYGLADCILFGPIKNEIRVQSTTTVLEKAPAHPKAQKYIYPPTPDPLGRGGLSPLDPMYTHLGATWIFPTAAQKP